MKVALVSTMDVFGGAAIAAHRIHRGLLSMGVESLYLVDKKFSNDDTVLNDSSWTSEFLRRIRAKIDYLPTKLLEGDERSISISPGNILKRIEKLNPDIVHLHWVNNGFVSIEQLAKIKKPIVWTLHDMWAFSDSRHYVNEVEKPFYCSDNIIDKWVWSRKKRSFDKIRNLTIVTPSKWLANCARESFLLKNRPVEVIANGIDTSYYQPQDRFLLKKKYGIPVESKVILFSASKVEDDRKGFRYLVDAISLLNEEFNKGTKTAIVVVGASNFPIEYAEGTLKFHLGNISSPEKMRDIYALSDVTVLPSKQDNLPNTLIEAMACGCPVVGFRVGGVPDIIQHKINGYLVNEFDSYALKDGITWVLKQTKHNLVKNCVSTVNERFNILTQAEKYLDLFSRVISTS